MSFDMHYLMHDVYVFLFFSLKFITKGGIDNTSTLVLVIDCGQDF